jgi:hypothetical protein
MIEDPHTPPACPTCKQPMVHTAVGDACMECGTLVKHEHPIPSQPMHAHAAVHATPTLSEDPFTPTPTIEHAPAQMPSPVQNAPAAQVVTKQDALRFRHRLKARLKRLVVPELPSKLDGPELPNSLSGPELKSPIEQPGLESELKQAALLSKLDHPELPEQDSTQEPLAPAPFTQEEVEASKHTMAYELAEEIAERDTEQTSPAEPASGATVSPSQVRKGPEPQINPPVAKDEQVAKTNSAPKKPKGKQATLLIGTVLCLALVAAIGVWMLSRQNSNQVVPATTNTSQPQVPGPPEVSPEATERDQKRKDDLNTISAALEVYKQQQGTYPAGDDIKVIYPLQYTTPPYITIINYDPSSTPETKIKYAYKSDGSTFTIAAKLEDSTDPDAQDGYYIVRSK